MKAVVLEIKDGVAAVLKEDGTVVKYTDSCEVGDTVEISEESGWNRIPIRNIGKYLSAAAAVAIVLAGVWSYSYVYASPYAYVSLDADSSVEFTLNRKEQVIAAEAVTEGATALVGDYEKEMPQRASVEDAVRYATDWFYDESYFDNEQVSSVLLNVASDNESETKRLKKSVSEAVDAVCSEHEQLVTIEMNMATKKERNEAREKGVSTGVYQRKNKRPTETVRFVDGNPFPTEQKDEMRQPGTPHDFAEDGNPQMNPSDESQNPVEEQVMPERTDHNGSENHPSKPLQNPSNSLDKTAPENPAGLPAPGEGTNNTPSVESGGNEGVQAPNDTLLAPSEQSPREEKPITPPEQSPREENPGSPQDHNQHESSAPMSDHGASTQDTPPNAAR